MKKIRSEKPDESNWTSKIERTKVDKQNWTIVSIGYFEEFVTRLKFVSERQCAMKRADSSFRCLVVYHFGYIVGLLGLLINWRPIVKTCSIDRCLTLELENSGKIFF